MFVGFVESVEATKEGSNHYLWRSEQPRQRGAAARVCVWWRESKLGFWWRVGFGFLEAVVVKGPVDGWEWERAAAKRKCMVLRVDGNGRFWWGSCELGLRFGAAMFGKWAASWLGGSEGWCRQWLVTTSDSWWGHNGGQKVKGGWRLIQRVFKPKALVIPVTLRLCWKSELCYVFWFNFKFPFNDIWMSRNDWCTIKGVCCRNWYRMTVSVIRLLTKRKLLFGMLFVLCYWQSVICQCSEFRHWESRRRRDQALRIKEDLATETANATRNTVHDDGECFFFFHLHSVLDSFDQN